MIGIAIHCTCIQHSQAMLERGVCELAQSFFHFQGSKPIFSMSSKQQYWLQLTNIMVSNFTHTHVFYAVWLIL